MIGFLTASLVSVVVAVGSFPDIPLEELKLRSSRLTCSVYYYYYIIIINIHISIIIIIIIILIN